ncbi:probable S-formylglutathione hydrolase [Saccharomycodes ludwigii]|uniref:S-formylglutathione hydrolase n=1 Tax=Saccharomycodes ludwigii TaxID=36035 RepID=A0A376B1V0_9ASCO|nr:hypothetical protein SCDLUD_003546 [Saccharomycodes ludwigii]KAH3900556.1 hypothetical protein SCDLUD_003546 [Saccharomycodes ludwigii]SSD58612.1 probable S-formylglutathione hydrolase [Saccharomycodes ludwigii]
MPKIFKTNAEIATCGGKLLKLTHDSKETGTQMDVNIYLPKQYYDKSKKECHESKIPTLYYLSGLTCTPNNASEKAFWQLQADKYGFTVVFPDTSPRGGDEVPDDKNDWSFGKGAGFYLNATEPKYAANYRMYDYVHKELPSLLQQEFGSDGKLDFIKNKSITGHSMGGYGAISGFLKNYGAYKSCSAFAPICNPSVVGWGIKCFSNYLGSDNKAAWKQYDPCDLVKVVKSTNASDKVLIHVGTKDPFLNEHLRPELLLNASKGTTWEGKFDINLVDNFDHSYYFISTFVPEHAEFHAKHLGLL